jgi:hypothetical protein
VTTVSLARRRRPEAKKSCIKCDRIGRLAGLFGWRDCLARFRYRTPVLTGRWRDSRGAALRDAIKAHQAVYDSKARDGVHWLVPGDIEEEQASDTAAARAGRG